MNRTLTLWVQGIGAWAPELPDWSAWRALLRGEGGPDASAPQRPKPERLSAGERRRVSTHVLAGIEVADQAVTMSGHDAAKLPCVFASSHGDAGIMDYMCRVLADTPQHLSPTRFHNSVHNAAVGYWTIATGCRAASSAVAAFTGTFGAGLLEAATQALIDEAPVLLVANDDPCSGPLGEVLATREAFACALVLSPRAGARAVARLDMTLDDARTPADLPEQPHARALAQANLSAPGLTLLEALSHDAATVVHLAVTPTLHLATRIGQP